MVLDSAGHVPKIFSEYSNIAQELVPCVSLCTLNEQMLSVLVVCHVVGISFQNIDRDSLSEQLGGLKGKSQ